MQYTDNHTIIISCPRGRSWMDVYHLEILMHRYQPPDVQQNRQEYQHLHPSNKKSYNIICHLSRYTVRNEKKKRISTHWVGFEPTWAEPIGFRIQRLNHSAISADAKHLVQNHKIVPYRRRWWWLHLCQLCGTGWPSRVSGVKSAPTLAGYCQHIHTYL